MIRRPPRSTPFPTRRSSDLLNQLAGGSAARERLFGALASTWDQLQQAKKDQNAAVQADKEIDRKSTRLNSSHSQISYAVFCLKKKKKKKTIQQNKTTYLKTS